MKKSKVNRSLDPILLKFVEKIAAIRFDSTFIVSNFIDAHKAFISNVPLKGKTTKDKNEFDLSNVRYRGMWAAVIPKDLTKSSSTCIGLKIKNAKCAKDKQLIDELIFSLNNQHLWLLVNAYEAYEEFYKNLYGGLGFLDRNIWRCSDFGDLGIKEIKDKNEDWFKNQVRKSIARYKSINDILQVLRRVFNDFAKNEEPKSYYVDTKYWIKIIEGFRHLIVHCRGRVKPEDFWNQLKKMTGHEYSSQNESTTKKRMIIKNYIKEELNDYLIWLIDTSYYDSINRLFFILIEILTDHAVLAYSCSIKYFKQKPLWEPTK